jgi:prealbumin domain-containing protein
VTTLRSRRIPIGAASNRLRPLMLLGLVLALMAAWSVPPAWALNNPDHVSFKLEGCKQDGTISFPPGGPFVCPDPAPVGGTDNNYTTGNLGTGWNELDLVPYRIIADAGNAAPNTQTYTVLVALDAADSGHPGYDVISAPVLNAALSSASCTAATVGADTILSPGLGGVDETRYRLVTITQLKSTVCVYDYFGRLAIGSHLFPGASLHANLMNFDFTTGGIGSKDVSIPVPQIIPQQLSKTMTATQNADHVWNIVKSSSPANVNFGDTCAPDATFDRQVGVSITWQILPATPGGPITVVTNITATNPAARSVTVTVSDAIRSGTTVLDTTTCGPTAIPANTSLLVCTHTFTVPNGTTNLNDIATATYTDTVTGQSIGETTTASASVSSITLGTETDLTASVTDSESITGTGLTFSVDSTTPGSFGSFPSYTLGTFATGPVVWNSPTLNANGSLTFNKTIRIAGPGIITSGTLSDTATLTELTSSTTHSASASAGISSTATVKLTITKTIPNILQGNDTVTFTFTVKDSGNNTVATPSITFTAGQTSKSVDVTGLAPGTYTVSENAVTGFAAQDPQTVSINLPSCAGGVTFNNSPTPAHARVAKVTIPADSSVWSMTLTGPGVNETIPVTANTGFANFAANLGEGSYTITETPQAGYDQTGTSGCSFTVNFPADAGQTFSCTITNTKRGAITIVKNTVGGDGTFSFTSNFGVSSLTTTAPTHTNSQTVNNLAAGTGYNIAETVPSDWTLTSALCDRGTIGAIQVVAGQTTTCTFTNTKKARILVQKVTIPAGDPQSFGFTTSYGAPFSLTDGGNMPSGPLLPGPGNVYSVAETPLVGWDLTSAVCSNGANPASITLQPGQSVVCTFTNTKRAHIIVRKVVDPATDPTVFSFVTTGAGYAGFNLGHGGSNDSGPLLPGAYSVSEMLPSVFRITGLSCAITTTGTGTSSFNVPSTPITVPPGPPAAAGLVTITAGAGDTVTCTYTNQKWTHIIVQKVTIPTDTSTSFEFTTTGDGYAGFSLVGGGSNDSGRLVPGLYTVAEAVPAGWDLTGLTCSITVVGAGTSGFSTTPTPVANPGSGTATITTQPGDTVTCIFTNTRRSTIIINKVTQGGERVFDYTGTAPLNFSLDTNVSKTRTFSNLVPGTYSVTEQPVTPAPGVAWEVLSLQCTDPTGNTSFPNFTDATINGVTVHVTATANINLAPGETVTCTFTNRKWGVIIVDKVTNPSGASQSFNFNLTGPVGGPFSLTDAADPFNSGAIPPGAYQVSETSVTGWDTSAVCNNGGSSNGGPISINLQSGQTITCTFTNTKRGQARVVKTIAGVPPSGTQAVEFQLRQGASTSSPGTILESKSATAGNGGVILFDTLLVPSTTYQLCEPVMPGWTTTIGNSFTVFNPDGDNSFVCGNFTVSPGETKTFQIDNVPPPGGLGRTIGFWKNWTSCDGKGNQAPVLDRTLELGNILIGTLDLSDSNTNPDVASSCLKAIRILDKSRIDTGAKQGGDPAFNVAAQLLAAKLNVLAGAAICTPVADAINTAQALLASINFNGITHGNISNPLKVTLNNLNTILDRYNNNLLCH